MRRNRARCVDPFSVEELCSKMAKIFYYRNDLCWANFHSRASPKLVRLIKWHPPFMSWHCEPVDWEHSSDLYVRPRFLTKAVDHEQSPTKHALQDTASLVTGKKLCRHERLSLESEGTKEANETSDTNSSMDDSLEEAPKTKRLQRAAKRRMLPLKQESPVDWYVQPHPPASYVREAQQILTTTPFECDVNPNKTAQILALMAMRTGQRPRDAFDRFLSHLGRTRTSRVTAPLAIRPEEVDFAGQRDGLYAQMNSVFA